MDFGTTRWGKVPNVVPAKPFAREYLHKLKGKGCAFYLLTATNERLARGALARLEMLEYFDELVTVVPLQNQALPDAFLHCAALAGAQPNECAVFEDSLYAIKTAKQAGLWSVPSPTKTRPRSTKSVPTATIISQLCRLDVNFWYKQHKKLLFV
jgi:beta-phosphoglucomutase-like phosphatase (HAD superfamily)